MSRERQERLSLGRPGYAAENSWGPWGGRLFVTEVSPGRRHPSGPADAVYGPVVP